MVATCSGAQAMLYVLPMLLGRTYDKNHDTVGIDIYDQKDIDAAWKNSLDKPLSKSDYSTIEESKDKRDFLGVSGELSLKISSGLLNIKGSGEYLKDTSNTQNSVEILIKSTFLTKNVEIDIDAKPLTYWQMLDRDSVGTHVVSSITYGGEMYASVTFIALKSEYLEDIKAEVQVSIAKSGTFNADAQGKLEKLAKNITNKAKMEIDYYGNVPLEGVPTTIQGLSSLVANFESQVKKVNNGIGVPVCVGFRPLSNWDTKFNFLRNGELKDALDEFDYSFNNLREAKSLMQALVFSLPESVPETYLQKIINFSGRLTDTLRSFHEVIGNMNLEEGSGQLAPAEKLFDDNSDVFGEHKYTKEILGIIEEKENLGDPPNLPRAVYVRWGKKDCAPNATNALYIGYMTSFTTLGIGAGTNYQCLPENPNLKLDSDMTGLNQRTSKLGGVRFKSMSVFKNEGKHLEGKGAPCTVCETPKRPTVQVFPASHLCPGDWVQEYAGYIVSVNKTKNRSKFVCVDIDPDTNEASASGKNEPTVLPIRIGHSENKNVHTETRSIPCAVCSK